MKTPCKHFVALFGIISLPLTSFAGSFSCDFNSTLPANIALYGAARMDDGVLKLVTTEENQLGSAIIGPLDQKPVSAFTVSFKALIGEGGDIGADGLGFYFSPDLSDNAFSEQCACAGLNIVFSTFQDPGEPRPGLKVILDKKLVKHVPVPVSKLRKGEFVDVLIKLSRDGTLDISYHHESLLADFPLGATNLTGRFAFASRTGSAVDNHFIDDLRIVTQPERQAFLDSYEPADDNASPSPIIRLVLNDGGNRIDLDSIVLTVDQSGVTALITKSAEGSLIIQYEPESLLEPGSSHSVHLSFLEREKSLREEFSYQFQVSTLVGLSLTRN